MLRVLVTVGLLSFAVWAALDVLQTPVARVQLLPKTLWFALTLVPLVGALAWLTLGRTVVARVRPPVRPVAPDDDPDFLRGLGDSFDRPPD